LGTIDALAEFAVKYDLGPQVAKTLAWIGTVALSGIIGNGLQRDTQVYPNAIPKPRHQADG
jgi:hypothetical protein